MAQKFNLESYRDNLKNQIATLYAKWAEMKANKHDRFWEIQDLEDEIYDLNLRLDPKFMCEYCYTDRHAYQVLRLETEKRMVVRRLFAKRVNVGEYWMSDAQSYEFTEDLEAPEITLRLHKDGRWYATNNCNPFGITEAPHEYFDYSF